MNIKDIKKALEKAHSELYLADLHYTNLVQENVLTSNEENALEYTVDALRAVRKALFYLKEDNDIST